MRRREYGLRLTGRRMEPRRIERPDMPLPAILFWELDHFVVLEGASRGRYHINDPANGRRSVTAEEFDRSFTGVVLLAERGPEFRPGGARPGIVGMLREWLRPVKAPLAFAAACGLLLAILPVLPLPVLLGVLVDHVLGGGQAASWGPVLVAAAGAAAALTYLLGLSAAALSANALHPPVGGPRGPLSAAPARASGAVLRPPVRR